MTDADAETLARFLHTARLTLRPAHAHDHDTIVHLLTDPHVRAYLGGPAELERIRARLPSVGGDTHAAELGDFMIADRVTDRPLGAITLDRRQPYRPGHVLPGGGELEVSYLLRRDAWGHGYAEEAARAVLRTAAAQLPDQPVLIATQAANTRSLALAVRLGFEVVDTFTEFDAEQILAVAVLNSFRP